MKYIIALSLLILLTACTQVQPIDTNTTNNINTTPEINTTREPELKTFTGYLLSGVIIEDKFMCEEESIVAPTNPFEYATKESCENAHTKYANSDCQPPSCTKDGRYYTGYVFSIIKNTCVQEEGANSYDPYEFHTKENCDLYYSINTINPDDVCREGRGCYKQYAIGRNDTSFCYEITDYKDKSIRESCFREMALQTLNPSLCEEISYLVSQTECKAYTEIAMGNTNASVCNQITSLSRVPVCLEHLAVLFKDFSYCELIDFEYSRINCENKVLSILKTT